MHKLKFLLLGLLLSTTSLLAEQKMSSWRPLPLIKNGQVDPSWVHIGYGKFVVDNGALRTDPAPEGLGLLVFKRERFGDCQLRVVFKPKEERSNSGFYVRIDDGILKQTNNPGAKYIRDSQGKPTAESSKLMEASAEKDESIWYGVNHGFEIQIAGDGESGTGSVYSLAPTTAAKGQPGEWRTMIITLDGTKIFVDLDGKRVTSFDSEAKELPTRKIWYQPKREPKRPTHGYIGLQTHDPNDIVWFKEISVRPLHRQRAPAGLKEIKDRPTNAD
jgi:hypothetical protein